jgi:hypothetical protein
MKKCTNVILVNCCVLSDSSTSFIQTPLKEWSPEDQGEGFGVA